jgi:hypothetical protein
MTGCQICGAEPIAGRKMRFIWHHTSYEPEIKVYLCYPCHAWLHGNGKIYKHPFKTKYGRDKAPYEFARAVVGLYDIEAEYQGLIKACDDLARASSGAEKSVYKRNSERIRSKARRVKENK